LLVEWNEMKKLYRGPYIDAFCQVWNFVSFRYISFRVSFRILQVPVIKTVGMESVFFRSPDHVRYRNHLASVVRPSSVRRFFLTLANQKQELPLVAIFVSGMERNEETV
jgi:hypothetical protein